MKLKVIACKVLFRELSYFAALSPHIVDVEFLEQQLHNEPEKLRNMVQRAIRDIENGSEEYDAILLGYGLCSNGIVGVSSRKYPIIVPRGHDCITILLGSKEKYQDYFNSHDGIYWYSSGWIERTLQPGKERVEMLRKQYIEKYGEDNADYLMEMEQGWLKKYNWASYIYWDQFHSEHLKEYTRACADYLGWNYDEIMGDTSLVVDLLNGNWDSKRFLVSPPNSTIAAAYDHRIVKSIETKD